MLGLIVWPCWSPIQGADPGFEVEGAEIGGGGPHVSSMQSHEIVLIQLWECRLMDGQTDGQTDGHYQFYYLPALLKLHVR